MYHHRDHKHRHKPHEGRKAGNVRDKKQMKRFPVTTYNYTISLAETPVRDNDEFIDLFANVVGTNYDLETQITLAKILGYLT